MLTDRGGFVQFFERERLEIGRWFAILCVIVVVAFSFRAQGADDLKSLVQQAFDLHQKGRFAEALPLLHRAYALEPEDYFVNLLLGIDSLRTGEPGTAVPFLKKASRLRPKEEFPLDYLGEAYARQDLYGEAADAYIKAVHVAPGSSDSSVAFVDFALSRFAHMSELLRSTRTGLAAEYRLRALALRKVDPSRKSLLQRAADLDPTAPGIWSDLTRAALDVGDMTSADIYSRQALDTDPNDQAAWVNDAQIAAEKSDWTRAIGRINSAAQRSPTALSQDAKWWPQHLQPPASPPVSGSAVRFFSCAGAATTSCVLGPGPAPFSLEGSSLFREQRWEQVTKLPSPKEGEAEGWFQRGIAFARLDDCQQAIPSLERGLSKTTPEVYGMFLLSWCYSREAGRTADKVSQSGSDEAPLHIMRGDILLRLQAKAELAASEYQSALALDPDDPAVLERLADAQLGAGKIDAARQSAQAALKIDPQRMAAERTLAKIAMQARDYATALPYLRELAARNVQDVTIRIELGTACAQTGALEEAKQNLEPALVQGYPDEKGSLHYLLGSVLKKMGKNVEAEQAFAAATQLSEAFQQKSYRDQDPDAQP